MAEPTAITDNNYVGDGTRVLFPFSFEYISVEDIRVSLDLVETTEFSLENATTVRMHTAPVAGAEVRVYRQTNEERLAATFYPGSAIRSQDLNDDLNQLLYLIQEGAADVSAGYWNKKNETTYKSDQVLDNVFDDDDHVMTNAAIIERHDTILSPDGPGDASQPGKFWVNTSTERIIYWNDKIGAWVDTSQTGPQGPSGTIEVGTTTTGDPGTDAEVTNSGDNKNAVFNFVIPRGDKGEQGDQGVQGDQGNPGINGTNGIDGTPATVTIGTTITGGQGTDAIVTNTGPDAQNAVFNFTIPRGDTGPQGPTGAGVTYLGLINATTTPAPADPANGDFYVNNTPGNADPSWGVGVVVLNSRLIYNEQTSQWDLLEPDSAIVNLDYSAAPTQGVILNTGGTDATIPAATQSSAGLLTSADKVRLDGMPDGGGNQGTVTNVTAHEPIYITGTSTQTPDINVRSATVDQSGVVQLVDSVSSDSHIQVPVAANVKAAYELAASKTDNVGTVTSVSSGSNEISVSNGTTTPTITIRESTTSQTGVVRLGTSTSSNAVDTAATLSAVKAAYDRGTAGVNAASTAQTTANNALPKSGGGMSGRIYFTERSVSGMNLAQSNMFTVGASTVPNPSNMTQGQAGLIRMTAAPTGWGSYWRVPPAPTSFPSIAPFYVSSTSQILVGPAVPC